MHSKKCDCTGRPCYECSTAGGNDEQQDDSLGAFLGYN